MLFLSLFEVKGIVFLFAQRYSGKKKWMPPHLLDAY